GGFGNDAVHAESLRPTWSGQLRFLWMMQDRRDRSIFSQLRPQNFGAEDGIRTRDPHLGKVAEPVYRVLFSPLAFGIVQPVSIQSTGFAAVVERLLRTDVSSGDSGAP